MDDFIEQIHSYQHLCGHLTGLTSILGLNGNNPLPLWTKALGSPGLNFEFVRDILDQVWDGQTRLCTVATHLEGPHIS